MNATNLCSPSDLLPTKIQAILAACPNDQECVQRSWARYQAMTDEDLLLATKTCLKNLPRTHVDLVSSSDAWLQAVLVPELWERIRAGTRTELRRISTSSAEYQHDPERPGIFSRLLGAERIARLQADADDLRAQIAIAQKLDTDSLVQSVRIAIAGSRAAETSGPAAYVYEPGFTYRLVPVIVCRLLQTLPSGKRDDARSKSALPGATQEAP